MSIPNNSVIAPFYFSAFESNDQLPRTPLTTDYEWGGTDISNVNDGLRVKAWKIYLNNNNVMLSAYPYTTSTVLFSDTGITELSLTLDQTMSPVVAFVKDSVAKFRWYDASLPGIRITDLPAGSTSPFAYLDDKREFASNAGINDVLIFYMLNNVLKYVQQRDQYNTHRILYTFSGVNKAINRVGMGRNLRLAIEVVDRPIIDTNTVFLLDSSGSSIADKSIYNSIVTNSTNAPVCTAEQSKWGTRSTKFTGTNCFATAPNTSLFNPGDNLSYTVESWVYLTTAANWAIVSFFGMNANTNYMDIGHSGSARYLAANTLSFGEQFNGYYLAPQVTVPLSTWTHIAVVRSAGAAQIPRVYMAGQYKGSFDTSHGFYNEQFYASLGWRDTTNSGSTFYLDDYRFTIGIERYTGTGSYSVPTGAF